MCESQADGGKRCAAHTRPAYEAIMADADLITPVELRKRVEANPAGLIDHLDTRSGNAQYAIDVYNLERAYEHDLARAPRLKRRRLYRDQQETLAAIRNAHDTYEGRKLARQHAATALDARPTRASRGTQAARGAVATVTGMVTAHTLTAERSRAIIDRIRATGGLTLDPVTGREPTTGYCINEVGECPKIPEADFFNPTTGHQALNDFLTTHADWFTGAQGKHIGMWHDTTHGVVVLDRVDVVQDLDHALALGKARNQRSMWDAKNAVVIPLR